MTYEEVFKIIDRMGDGALPNVNKKRLMKTNTPFQCAMAGILLVIKGEAEYNPWAVGELMNLVYNHEDSSPNFDKLSEDSAYELAFKILGDFVETDMLKTHCDLIRKKSKPEDIYNICMMAKHQKGYWVYIQTNGEPLICGSLWDAIQISGYHCSYRIVRVPELGWSWDMSKEAHKAFLSGLDARAKKEQQHD